MKKKRGEMLQKALIQILIVGLIFAIFFTATAAKINARGVRQQVLEKQTALLIESATPGMQFKISKPNLYGYIQRMEIKQGRIYITIEGLPSVQGYPYFTPHKVELQTQGDYHIITITKDE